MKKQTMALKVVRIGTTEKGKVFEDCNKKK